jgi:hypothetical protein
MIAAAGLLIMLLLGHNYSMCQSFIGQLAQAGSAQDQATCNFASGALDRAGGAHRRGRRPGRGCPAAARGRLGWELEAQPAMR